MRELIDRIDRWAGRHGLVVHGRAMLVAVAATVLILVGIELSRELIELPNRSTLYLLAVVIAASLGGVVGGFLGAFAAIGFAFVTFSRPGDLLTYAPEDASRVWFLTVTSLAMAGLVGLLRERAEHRRVIEVDERQRTVTATSRDAVVTIDDSSRIQFANEATGRIFGYREDELIGQPLTMLMPERYRQAHRASLERYRSSGSRTISWDGVELTAVHRSGEEIPVEVSFGEYRAGGRRTFTGTIRDIRERKRLEGQLVEAQKMEAIGRLAGGIAHDFNNILTAISGFAALLREDLQPTDPRRAEAEAIGQASDRASGLVRQLLAFGRRQVLHPVVLDLTVVIEELLPMLRPLIGERVTISWLHDEGLWLIDADRSQIEQVIVNLVVNARDAMPGGGQLTLEASNVELDRDDARRHVGVVPGGHVLLAVSDTGIGMDAATQARVFEPFFTTKEQGRGTGLGLASVHGIVTQSGGHIWVYSEPGRGSTFKIYFPSSANVPAETESTATEPAVIGGNETILLVEHNAAVRRLIEAILARLGYRVHVAEDGRAAIEIVRTHPIDLLITDLVMPGPTGQEVAADVTGLQAGVKVLFISGYTEAAAERHAMGVEKAMLLEKPFSPIGLSRAVRAALAGPDFPFPPEE